MAGIFRSYPVDITKDVKRPKCNIVEVSDRRRTKVKARRATLQRVDNLPLEAELGLTRRAHPNLQGARAPLL